MTKSINWPQEFSDEIKNEDNEIPKIALRIGSLYFDNAYYSNGEEIFIRVNHIIARKGQIIDDLKLFKIGDLPDEILSMNKEDIRQKNDVIKFLSSCYNQQVNDETIVTVITYKNLNEPIENN